VLLLAATGTVSTQKLPQDLGASGTWQRLLKLQTTASAMHTTAHPDDEQGGVLAWLSRGAGARVALATLTSGESGDNAIGPELFDAVGLIRTEELRRADQYYGVDRQYFTTVIDYGFSKRLDEALEKWGKETVLRDMVAIIRLDRPFVIVSRFQGSARDGHGNHQAAGLITRDAFTAAGDPSMFPDLIAEGLPPWQPLKLYVGGVREDEDWTLRVDSGQYSPSLGDSYGNFARLGLAFQRSQNSGRVTRVPGPSYNYYQRLATSVAAPDRETSFFDGIDTRVEGIFRALGRPEPSYAAPLLTDIAESVAAATRAFTPSDPSRCVPPLASGLRRTREAIARLSAEPDVVFLLKIKEQQFQDAINSALGVEFSAVAQRARTGEPAGPQGSPPQPFGPLVPGQTFDVRTTLTAGGSPSVASADVSLVSPARWRVVADERSTASGGSGSSGEVGSRRFIVTVPPDAPLSRPFFSRTGIDQSRYVVVDPTQRFRPVAEPPLTAVARYAIAGVSVESREPVTRFEPNLPYGDEIRELAVLPALAVNVTPQRAIVPLAMANKAVSIGVEVVNNQDEPATGQLRLEVPEGWSATPASATFAFTRPGERSTVHFSVRIPSLDDREYVVRAVATAGGAAYREGFDVIHIAIWKRAISSGGASRIRGVDVKLAPNLSVGYTMESVSCHRRSLSWAPECSCSRRATWPTAICSNST
jgi:LmbE family N-acetylglucosaminyl deacetylase